MYQVWHLFSCEFLKTTSSFLFIILLPESYKAPEIMIKTLVVLTRISSVWFITRSSPVWFCLCFCFFLWAITHHDWTLKMCFRVYFPFSLFLSFKMTAECFFYQHGFEYCHVFTSIVQSFRKTIRKLKQDYF